MKKFLKRLLCFFAICYVVGIVMNLGDQIASGYNTKMQAGLEKQTVFGTKIVAYDDVKGVYSKDYVPFAYQTGDPEAVGAVLHVDKSKTVSQMYSGGMQVRGNVIVVELVDCRTGQTINSRSFSPYFPARYKSGSSVNTKESVIAKWVADEWAKYLAEQGIS